MADRFQVLFEALDLEGDGRLTADELERAASGLGWSWREAPLYTTLHRLAVHEPLGADVFAEVMRQVTDDRHGPFGEVLARVPPPAPPVRADSEDVETTSPAAFADVPDEEALPVIADVLEQSAEPSVAAAYRELVEDLSLASAPAGQTALLVIDPQRSFTQGAWMRSIGPEGAPAVSLIKTAFERAAARFRSAPLGLAKMLTRCSFPPDSYGWDDAFKAILPPDQPYFVKPGNNVLWPESNGFRAWLEGLVEAGWDGLVLGGCTLNSCVRVSAVETQRTFGDRLRVYVDLSLCGARLSNYLASEEFDGRSSVDAAVTEMRSAGVVVAQTVGWE